MPRSVLLLLLVLLALFKNLASPAAAQDLWSGNMARNPGFDEDFVNLHAEGHVLSFKGDWYYNQQDLVPDYWDLAGDWQWSADHKSLKLADKATARQSFVRATYQEGGGAWGGGSSPAIPMPEADIPKFTQPWRVTVSARGGGSVTIASGKATRTVEVPPGNTFQQVTAELPAEEITNPAAPVTVTLTGPGEFDEVSVNEKIPASPNLAINGSFESLNPQGYPARWSQQQKYRAIGPTYYVWTDWNHYFRENRGAVAVDPLVAFAGRQSLRFDVYPGDEKLVESDLIVLNQDQPRVIEVGCYVRADRIKLIDIRCVDDQGYYMPGYRPRQPENNRGGTFLFGNGTFPWRYVRKFFAAPNDQPVKAFRVRLCARGMNGNTLDDGGTRSYSMQVGTVWWDDLYVAERTSTAADLNRRKVPMPPQRKVAAGAIIEGEVDLGERFYGQNQLTYNFTSSQPGSYSLRLATTLPGAEPQVTTSATVTMKSGERKTLSVPYVLKQLAPELDGQGTFKLELLRDGQPLATSTYAFNTWPDVIDMDVSRHYNLPQENPVTISMNLGVAAQTLAQVKNLELALVRTSDNQVLRAQQLPDLQKQFADTIAALPKTQQESYEFNLPTPAWWVDRTNLIITRVDLSPLKVWSHDTPQRDTVLRVRGLNAAGEELFRDESAPFGRMQQRPPQGAIDSVAVREDGAVLINNEPKFLTGATHQHSRLTHTFDIIQQLGLMGHRLPQGKEGTFESLAKLWTEHNLYALQAKPISGQLGTAVVTDMTPEQRKALEEFVRAGGMQNIVSLNTGGWEATIKPDDPQQVATHSKFNDYIRQVTKRPVAISTSGAFNAWWLPELVWYDINHAETEMWGPMDFNVIFTPYMKAAGRNTAWVYLPQLYDNHPYDRYRFETYENIIRGSAGVSMIQGIGDPTFNRGLAGELRYLESPLNSQEQPPEVSLEPNLSHKVTRHGGKTYVLATNAGPIQVGEWKWNTGEKFSGRASHEGDTVNQQWFRPAGIRIHGFRGLPLPEQIQPGDKIVQYVWLDPTETPEWVMLAVRGNGRFAHNGVLGKFDFNRFRQEYGNIVMYSELNHSVWHEINWVMDDATYQRGVQIMGKDWADRIKAGAAAGREKVDKIAYQSEHFHALGGLPAAGQWHCLEIDAERAGLVGKLVDGFAYLTQNGRALWDHTVLERNGEVVRVFCEDTVGIDRALLPQTRIEVAGLAPGTPIKVLFEGRTLRADDAGGFVDDFTGVDTYGYENGAITGDLFGFVKDPDRELARMMPSGYGYTYGPTAVHIYEIGE